MQDLLSAPAAAIHLELRHTGDPAALLRRLAALQLPDHAVLGLGAPWITAAGGEVDGHRAMPALRGASAAAPSTQADLWLWVRADEPGVAWQRARALLGELGPELELVDELALFRFDGGRDLTGYEDGTENPTGDDALAAAVVADGPLAGSSFAAVQRWTHRLDVMAAMPPRDQDLTIGRERSSNEEIDDAPDSAHVKRAAQEDYDPPAFMLRRSMPWGGVQRHGLLFLAFGADLDRFERVLRRMLGLDDGVTDNLFRFSTPETGAYYWCPAVDSGRLRLDAAGLRPG
jgi:putative iron-dependent peroxidase